MDEKIYTTILAGGHGTRLWPLSREEFPKQFIKFFDHSSLFQKTIERALIFSKPDEILIVTNERFRFRVMDQLDEMSIKIPEENILLEPEPKNTLPAILWAVLEISKKNGSAKVAVLPSDHLIEVNKSYKNAFKDAEALAEKYLVTFGVKPTKPHTGYGYIKPGKILGKGYEVEKFVEKPDIRKAKIYIEKNYLWNSGMFLFKPEIFIQECEKYQNCTLEHFRNDIFEAYRKIQNLSVDFGIMEKSKRVAVVPLETFWSDVGSFDSIYQSLEKDKSGNAVRGEYISVDSENNLIISSRLLATIGMSNTVVVDTGDAILVSPRKDSERVKEIVNILKSKGDERVKVHLTSYRPWGSFTVLEEGEMYKIKRLTVLPGKRLSLQRHKHRSEHWVVVRGEAKVRIDGKEFLMKSGESTFIEAGKIHRLENPSRKELEIIEVQIGDYLGEDDIERFDDDFGRIK